MPPGPSIHVWMCSIGTEYLLCCMVAGSAWSALNHSVHSYAPRVPSHVAPSRGVGASPLAQSAWDDDPI